MTPFEIVIASVSACLERMARDVSSGGPCVMPPAPSGGFDVLGAGLLETNRQIWELEDRIRTPQLPVAEVAETKRAIDPRNQLRNDYMNAIDRAVYDAFAERVNVEGLPYNSESIGSIADRMSVLSLKVHHLSKPDDDATQISRRKGLADNCVLMRSRLHQCAVRILTETAEGRMTLVDFRQIKLYNDPTLNPVLKVRGVGAQ